MRDEEEEVGVGDWSRVEGDQVSSDEQCSTEEEGEEGRGSVILT